MQRVNKHLLLLGLLSVLFVGCSSKEYDIQFTKPVYDFGEVNEGTDVEFAFEFKNTGTQILTIESVQPTCGCTVANTWDREVLPGKKGRIPVTFKTFHYRGEVSKIINVITNVPEQPTVPLTIKGKVIVPIEITPLNPWLGEVDSQTEVLTGSFEIKNNLKQPLKIIEVIPPDEQVKFSLVEEEANQRYRLDYTVHAPFAGKERIEKKFTLKTDNKAYEYIYPTFYYLIPPPLHVFPDRLLIDPTQIKDNIVYTVNARSSMPVPIKILDLKHYTGKGITFELKEVVKDKHYQIAITISPGFRFPENEQVYLRFRVENDPQKALYNVPIEEYKISS